MGASQISGYDYLHMSSKSVNFAKIFVSISLYKRIFIVMRQVIKKNLVVLVEMIDKMRCSNEARRRMRILRINTCGL